MPVTFVWSLGSEREWVPVTFVWSLGLRKRRGATDFWEWSLGL